MHWLRSITDYFLTLLRYFLSLLLRFVTLSVHCPNRPTQLIATLRSTLIPHVHAMKNYTPTLDYQPQSYTATTFPSTTPLLQFSEIIPPFLEHPEPPVDSSTTIVMSLCTSRFQLVSYFVVLWTYVHLAVLVNRVLQNSWFDNCNSLAFALLWPGAVENVPPPPTLHSLCINTVGAHSGSAHARTASEFFVTVTPTPAPSHRGLTRRNTLIYPIPC